MKQKEIEYFKEFLRFLKNKNVYHQFKYNIVTTNDQWGYFKAIRGIKEHNINITLPTHFIVNAFDWENSALPKNNLDNFNYWDRLSTEWRRKLDILKYMK